LSTKQALAPRKRIPWVYSTLPVNAALGPIGTFVSLYLLRLNGLQAGTAYVALAATLFNAVGIPAALFWGLVTDRLRQRKRIIVMSYVVTAVYLFSFFFAGSSTPGMIFVYCLVSFISAASATPLNLLIMETEPKNRWAAGFARLSLASSVGSILGYVLSAVWVQLLPGLIIWLILPLGVLSLLSAASAAALIQEPGFAFEKDLVVMQRPGFFHRLRASPMIFFSVPRASDFQRIFKGLRNELTSYVPLLYLSIVTFYFASGVFNASIVSSLYAHSLSDSQVYSVTLVVLVAQILAFRYAGRYIASRSLTGVAVQGLVLRGASYAALGVASLFATGSSFIIPTLIFYPLSSGLAYGVYYTASNTMVFNSIRGNNHGSSLGVYSAIVGISTTLGSVLSGAVSVYLGFHSTFVLAGALLGVAALITARLSNMNPMAAPE
jgi:MFS family permease